MWYPKTKEKRSRMIWFGVLQGQEKVLQDQENIDMRENKKRTQVKKFKKKIDQRKKEKQRVEKSSARIAPYQNQQAVVVDSSPCLIISMEPSTSNIWSSRSIKFLQMHPYLSLPRSRTVADPAVFSLSSMEKERKKVAGNIEWWWGGEKDCEWMRKNVNEKVWR